MGVKESAWRHQSNSLIWRLIPHGFSVGSEALEPTYALCNRPLTLFALLPNLESLVGSFWDLAPLVCLFTPISRELDHRLTSLLPNHFIKSDSCGVHHGLSEFLRRYRLLVPLTGILINI